MQPAKHGQEFALRIQQSSFIRLCFPVKWSDWFIPPYIRKPIYKHSKFAFDYINGNLQYPYIMYKNIMIPRQCYLKTGTCILFSAKADSENNRVQNCILYLRLDGQVTPRSCKCFHPIKQRVWGRMPGSETHRNSIRNCKINPILWYQNISRHLFEWFL